jgi:nitrite reductase/ring-hydroxylating ferredoxin subunit
MRSPLKKQKTDTDTFIPTVAIDTVLEGEMTTVTVKGRRIILTRFEGQLFAIDAACPHAAADLSKGSLSRWRVCCHEHDYCFDIRNGRIVWPEDEVYRLRIYEVQAENGIVKIRIDSPR